MGYNYAVGFADSVVCLWKRGQQSRHIVAAKVRHPDVRALNDAGEPSHAENAKINKQSNRLIFFIASPLIIAASFTRVLLFSHVVYGVVKIAKIF